MTSPWTPPGSQPGAPSGIGAEGLHAGADPLSAPPAPARAEGPTPPAGEPGTGLERELTARAPLFPLRPLTLGEVLTAGGALYRHRRRFVLGVTAIVLGIAWLVQSGLSGVSLIPVLGPGGLDALAQQTDPQVLGFGSIQDSLLTIGLSLVSGAITLLASQMILVLLVRTAVDDARGRETPDAALRRHMLRRTPAAMLVGLVGYLVPAVPFLLLGALGALPLILTQEFSWWAVGFLLAGLVLGMLLAAYVWLRLQLATPALAVEDIGVLAAMRRSLRLTGGRDGWRHLGTLLLVLVLTSIAVSVVSSLGSLLGFLPMVAILLFSGGSAAGAAMGISLVVTLLAGYLSMVLVVPFLCGTYAAVYADARMRREGWDAELMAEQAAADQAGRG